jgi:hypothetical protein
VLPSPSSPALLHPQHLTAPAVVTAHEWPPAETVATPEPSPTTSTGVLELVLVRVGQRQGELVVGQERQQRGPRPLRRRRPHFFRTHLRPRQLHRQVGRHRSRPLRHEQRHGARGLAGLRALRDCGRIVDGRHHSFRTPVKTWAGVCVQENAHMSLANLYGGHYPCGPVHTRVRLPDDLPLIKHVRKFQRPSSGTLTDASTPRVGAD